MLTIKPTVVAQLPLQNQHLGPAIFHSAFILPVQLGPVTRKTATYVLPGLQATWIQAELARPSLSLWENVVVTPLMIPLMMVAAVKIRLHVAHLRYCVQIALVNFPARKRVL